MGQAALYGSARLTPYGASIRIVRASRKQSVRLQGRGLRC